MKIIHYLPLKRILKNSVEPKKIEIENDRLN